MSVMAHARALARACILGAGIVGAMLGSCELFVGIPDVTLAIDGGNDGGNVGGACGTHPGPSMVEVDALLGKYCIDTTEVTVSQFNGFIIATGGSLAGTPAVCTGAVVTPPVDNAPEDQNLPIGDLGECHAWAYCQWAGKRLCGAIATGGGSTIGVDPRETEWTYACIGGVLNLAYPYGSTFDPQACNIDHPDAGVVPVASMPACKGTVPPFDQIYDMVGNLWEFQNDLGDDGMSVGAEGGSYISSESDLSAAGGGCTYRNGFNGLSFDFPQSGFRCCADLPP
jgi:sulfatase modifying factor 1